MWAALGTFLAVLLCGAALAIGVGVVVYALVSEGLIHHVRRRMLGRPGRRVSKAILRSNAYSFVAPFVYLLHLALTVGTAAVTAAFVVLGVGLIAGPVALVGEGSPGDRVPGWAPFALAIAAAGLFLAGGLLSGFDADRARPDSLLYALDADTGEAAWATLQRCAVRLSYRSNVERASLHGASRRAHTFPPTLLVRCSSVVSIIAVEGV